jgi:hypothetical protein
VGNFGAKEAFEASFRVEIAAREGDLPRAEAACTDLEQAIARLAPALAALVKEGEADSGR